MTGVSSWAKCLIPLESPSLRGNRIRGGRTICPAFSNEESNFLHDMSLTLPPASRQSHISHSATDNLLLPMLGFSEMVLQICFTSSSVISGLFVVFMIYLFDMKLMSPAIFENLIRKK